MKSPSIFLSLVAAVAMTFGLSTSTAYAEHCTGDVNQDQIVDGQDLAMLLADWGTSGGSGGADINGDGTIDGIDLAIVVSGWGPCCDCCHSPPANDGEQSSDSSGVLPGYTVLEQYVDAAVVTNVTMRNAITASGLPWRVQDTSSGIEMLLVPLGTFMMGCSPSDLYGCQSNESPKHEVTLSAFYMGRYEVTQAQWQMVMGCNPSYFKEHLDSPLRPVERVSWSMIAAGSTSFMGRTGCRLPTEAEWEYAYRAGTTTAFHSYPAQPTGFDDDALVGNIAWYDVNAGSQTHAKGGKAANDLGLYDMSGNVREWCQDLYGLYSSGSVTNPTGPATGTYRLLRGGSWGNSSEVGRASQRSSSSPDAISMVLGFRVARTPDYPAPAISSVSPTSGSTAGGTAITITGTSLNGATSVTVGGVAATSVVVVSSTSITAVTPAGTVGAKSVAVTTPGGSATATNAFTYVVPTGWYIVLEQYVDAAVVTNVTMRNAITASGLPWRVQDNSSGIEMLLVPAGTFPMGCSESTLYLCQSDESPTHQVTLTQAFYMGRSEVTQAQWTAKMGSNPSYFVPANGYSSDTTKPVERVSWNMIASGSTSFMSLTGLRLPTEAEWEYAYRAETTTAFHSFPGYTSGTNDDTLLGNIAWYSANAGSQTHAVGGKFANALGLHDMSGNVWEWCQDLYGPYSSGSVKNPTGPDTGWYRLLRGGDWNFDSYFCRASQRFDYSPGSLYNIVGFRVARTP